MRTEKGGSEARSYEPASSTVNEGPTRRLLRFTKGLNKYALILAWLIMILVFSLLEPSQYFTRSNLESLFSTQAPLLLMALACIPPIIVGDLDLSVASMAGLSLVITGYLNVTLHWPISIVIVIALAVGLAVGLTNAGLVVGMGIDCIVTTLGIGTLLTGFALGIASSPIGGISAGFTNLIGANFLGLQVGFWFVLICCIAMWYVLSHTPLGRRLYFVGASRDAARLSGVRVARLRMLALIASALLAALDGVVLAGIDGSADSTTGPSLLFPALAAVFLGATAIAPGRFNVWGTFVAVYFLVFGIAGLEILGISGWVSQVFYGGSLVAGVALARLSGAMELGAGRLARKRTQVRNE
jgi:ribose transport system permease protein